MKKKIAILGSTSSIGKSLLKIIKKNQKKFEITLLTANTNHKDLLKQAKIFNVKNLIITDNKSFEALKSKNKNKKIKIYNNFKSLNKIFNKKIDYVMSAISGIEGLEPTFNIIKHTKLIAIANKEAIICGWNLIKKELEKNKTNFLPVDSEHFSIWYSLKDQNTQNIEKIFITASGGPLYKTPFKKLKNIKLKKVLKHPNWKMGKKISIDSATMMNKIFEVIEAKNIFDITYNKLSILVHPKSYIHALVKFNDGMTKIILHNTTMEIPIFNTLYSRNEKKYQSTKLDIDKLNNLELNKIDKKKFPLIKILKKIPNKSSLFETVIVSANDVLVNLYLNNKIKFLDIQNKLLKLINLKEFKKYKKIKPNNIKNIYKLNKYVSIKTKSYCV
tara:strand:- start:1635 stop:2798 length:1164 start_codon:yes stop_codon:yes gene_type:complete